ncbi:MAG: hypothetical protein ACKOXG_01940 [Arenimonas sp.]
MTAATIRRLGWQIPLLLLLPSLLMPAWSWHSVWFGLWPLWLAAMPLVAHGLSRRAARSVVQAPRPARTQVLVFPVAARPTAPAAHTARQAA